MTGPVVYYSLDQPPHPRAQIYQSQLICSLEGLRGFNPTLPVYLHVVGQLERAFAQYLTRRFAVRLVSFSGYQEMLDAHLPGAGRLLADYPILHKFLTLRHFCALRPAQVLYVDSDTLFYADPLPLMQRCTQADIYARAEPHSDPRQADAGYFDHAGLARLQQRLGCRPIKPFNTGVMILNHGIWDKFLAQARFFLELVLAFSPKAVAAGLPGLPLPVNNPWIRDQVAFWLSLGRLESFELGLLSYDQLLLGGEELFSPGVFARPVITHYFTANMAEFFQALQQQTMYREKR